MSGRESAGDNVQRLVLYLGVLIAAIGLLRLRGVARALEPALAGGIVVVIGYGLRYAHAATYVRAVVESAGLKLPLLEDRSARNEDNAPVPGLVAVAAKT